jgi:ribosomal protein S18 acetylase RimI-like enzyme
VSIVISELKEEHIEEYANLWIDFMKYHENFDKYFQVNEKAKENYKTHTKENIESDKWFLLAVFDSGKMIGRGKAEISDYPPIFMYPKFGHLWELHVLEEYRGKDIGKELVKKIMDWFKEKGIVRVELEFVPDNNIGKVFWKSRGFKVFMNKCYIDIS